MRTARRVILAAVALAAALALPAAAAPYSFGGLGGWGIQLDITTGGAHPGSISIDTPAGVQAIAGSYQWTLLNGSWVEETRVPLPGASYAGNERFDAEALFFKADQDNAYFAVLTGTPQTGVAWPQWYGSSLFGPGDLRVEIDGETYGVGMRTENNLAWDSSNGNSYMHRVSDGFDTKNASSRAASSAGMVVKSPEWWWTDNPNNSTPNRFAFFEVGTGTLLGNGSFASYTTSIIDAGYANYIYEAKIPWSTLGYTGLGDVAGKSVLAYWQPDCGNDGINGTFQAPPVPEPASMVLAGLGLSALGALRKRRV